MTNTEMAFGFWPGRFDGNIHEGAKYVRNKMDHNELAWFGGTELQQKDAHFILRETLGKQYALRTIGEFWVACNRDLMGVDGKPSWLFVTDLAGVIGWRQMHQPAFPLHYKPWDTDVMVMPYHAPSGVQHGDDMTRTKSGSLTPQSQVWMRGMTRQGNRMNKAQRQNKTRAVIAIGDSNQDHHRKSVRDRIVKVTRHPTGWAGNLPAANVGDHAGHRLILGCQTYGVKVTDLVPHNDQPKSFDHGCEIGHAEQEGKR